MSVEREAPKFPFVDPSKLSSAAVVCHRNADADAYLSAYALSSLIRSLAPGCDVDIGTPDGMTALTAKLSEKFSHKTADSCTRDYDLFVAVDVGDVELLKQWKDKMRESRAAKVLVDHHPLQDRSLYDHAIVDENATSAAEVVWRLYRDTGKAPDRMSSQALLEALLFDSSHLAIAGAETLRAAVGMIDAGADIAEAKRDLRTDPDYGEVIAKLKGARRLKIYRVGEWVVTTSTIGSFQAHVARSLLHLGSDVSIVGGETEGETRVSARATQRFADVTKLHLGAQVAEEVAGKLGGHGGGHATAASFSTKAGEEEAVKETLARLSELLQAEGQELT